ncbi:MAG: flagellar basal body-associated FliL family protein [Nitrospinae bacterium]|nr:flagellar basal body-associated FliL family protein [Nitrospinota bacterium]
MAKKRKTELDIEATGAVPAEEARAVDAPKEEAPQEAPPPPPKPKRRPRAPLSAKAKRNIIIAVAALIVLSGASMVAKMASGPRKQVKSYRKERVVTPVEKPAETKLPKISNVVLEPFTFTVKGKEGDRFIRLVLALQMSNEFVVGELEENMPLIRTSILFYMNTRDPGDLLVAAKRKEILQNIQYNVDRSLQEGRVETVLINELSVY